MKFTDKLNGGHFNDRLAEKKQIGGNIDNLVYRVNNKLMVEKF